MAEPTGGNQSPRFLALYALAWAGGATAYVPFLTILMPVRTAALAGPAAFHWLAYLAFTGAIAASLANIVGGRISDALGNRRLLALLGLAAYAAITPTFSAITRLPTLIVAITVWQTALNFMLAPLGAWAADTIPDHQKGQLGGLMALAPASGALSGVFVTSIGVAEIGTRLAIIAVLVVAMVLPVLVVGRPRPGLVPAIEKVEKPAKPDSIGRPARMWVARLLVQIAEATLFAFLYFWLRSLDSGFDDATVAKLFMGMLVVGIPVSMLAGRWSDHRGEPFVPLKASAALAAAGLAVMALASSLFLALAGYALFSLFTSAFLSLHSAQILRVLPRADRRGRDLGYFNLTNTVPSLIMPGIALALVPGLGFTPLFAILAGLAVLATLVLPRQ